MPKHLTLSLGLLALLIHAEATWAAAADAAPTAAAVQALEAQLKKTPQAPDALGKLGSARLAQKRYAEARAALLKAQQAAPRPGRELADQGRRGEIAALLKDVDQKLK